ASGWARRAYPLGPTACACCGSTRLAKLGEDVTETLESVPRQWKVVQYVREKFTCRACEAISQTPAPFHVLPRGFAGPSLLAMIALEKYGQHQPLNRQAERYARGLRIDDKLELGRLLDRQVGRLGALEDAADIHGHLPIRVYDVGSVAHQSADLADVARAG